MSAAEELQGRELAGCIGLSTVRCTIDPAAKCADLANDFECLFGSAFSALEEMTADVDQESTPAEVREPWYAMLYTMRQARTVWKHLHERIDKPDLSPKGGAS